TVMRPSASTLGRAFFRVLFLDPDDYLKGMEEVQSCANMPYYEVQPRLSGFDHPGAGLMNSALELSSREFAITAMSEARDSEGRLAVAATKYRLDHGVLPDGLQKLIPDYLDTIPLDPFDGKPMKLTLNDGQWSVYSIGPKGENAFVAESLMFTLRPAHPAARPGSPGLGGDKR
ncbi:MAG TPA: hypothetical protein VL992_13610, partial [Tepidisphaeraceae bacterium]|nr:hypothetical protein [Tepidisphaeraceae bacterium]